MASLAVLAEHLCSRRPDDVSATLERYTDGWLLTLSEDGALAVSAAVRFCPWCGLVLMAPKQPMAVADAHVSGD
jgi:hypothetical protein